MRSVPLVLVASPSPVLVEEVAGRLRHEGKLVCVARSADGCLRVATSIAPDVIVLDPLFPARLVRLLRAHPRSATAEIVQLPRSLAPIPIRASRLRRLLPTTAGPHAA